MTYDNTNRGALFKAKERKSEKSPEYTGSLNIDGKEFYLSAWVKDGKSGKFFSLAVKPKEQQTAAPAKQTVDKAYAKAASTFDDSEIPF
jgi:hypothetical protein